MAGTSDKPAVKIDDAAARAKGLPQQVGDKVRTAGKTPEVPPAEGIVGAVKEKVQDAAAGAGRLLGKVEDTAQEWASSAGSAAGQAKDKAWDVAAGAAEKVSNVEQDVEAFIRRHPLEAVLVGFGLGVGVGFLAAQLLPRR